MLFLKSDWMLWVTWRRLTKVSSLEVRITAADVMLIRAPGSMVCGGSCYHSKIMRCSVFFTQIKSQQRQNSGIISPTYSMRREEINFYGDG